MSAWTAADIPDQTGRFAVVTGANTGLGFATARALVAAGARVLLACRSAERCADAVSRIAAAGLPGSAEAGSLDLSDLDSVRAFAASLAEAPRLDLLINNAGLLMPPEGRTQQGFELQLGVNHLGHFALTGLLLPALLRSPGARVVTVSSLAHTSGTIRFDDLQFERRRYSAWFAYAQSKLANLMFALELQRRLAAAGHAAISAAAHPGWSATALFRGNHLAARLILHLGMRPEAGALPSLRAATDPSLTGGEYLGPRGPLEIWGAPVPAGIARRARRAGDAARLFEVSESLTGVQFGLG